MSTADRRSRPTSAKDVAGGGRSAARTLLAVAALAAVIFGLHGRSLGYGLFLDDQAHFDQLHAADWSLRSLVDACRLELVGGTIDLWFLPNCTLRFFRPVAFGLMKLTYTLGGWSPAAAHGASLLWHLAVCVLLMQLLRRLGATRMLAWVITALFAIHPGHVATVQWIATQSELMVTTFLLGALLCFARYRGWGAVSGESSGGAGWAVATAVFFTLALGCRENAIVFPVIALVVDFVHRRDTLRRAVVAYAALGVLAIGYLALRTAYLSGAALPPRPYVVPPTAADFIPHVFNKACYYLLCEFLLIPCVPIGGLAYFENMPFAFYGLAALIVVAIVLIAARARSRLPVTVGLAWLIGFMGPVLPAFESPHHLYLPGIGAAILAMAALRWTTERHAQPALTRVLAMLVLAATGVTFGLLTFFSGMAFSTGARIEHQIRDEILASPVPLHDGDTLYIANFPMIAHYLKLTLEREAGVKNLHVVPLTWAPRVTGVTSNSELRRIDDHTIEAWIAGDRYFSGVFGRLIEQAQGEPLTERLKQPVRGRGFAVEIAEQDEQGISALRFTFDRPLSDPGVHLFWGSRTRWAARIPFVLPQGPTHGAD